MSRGQGITLRVFRFDPAVDSSPHYTNHVLPHDEHTTLLDALEHVHEEGEPLAFLHECRMFKCGSCAVQVNGRPYLACKTKVVEFKAERELVIEPLTCFPLIKDLLVDFSQDLAQRSRLRPFPEAGSAGCSTATPGQTQREMLGRYTACIRCAICNEACLHVRGRDEVRPMSLLDVARLASDPRDGSDRVLQALSERIRGCNECRECDRACPVGLDVFQLAVGRLRKMIEARSLA